jgi:hypothetical protein
MQDDIFFHMEQTRQHIHQLKEKGLEVSFKHCGKGRKTTFTFSGIGMDNRYFSKFFKEQEEENSFFHFSIKVLDYSLKEEIPDLWLALINSIIKDYQITHFNIVAYSIGARLSYPLLNHRKLNQTILICPDGVIEHPIYLLATRTTIGQKLFFPIFKMVRFAAPSIEKFIKLSPMEVFYLWKLHSVFKFPEYTPSKLIVYLAKHDLICPPVKVSKALKRNKNNSIYIIETNHFSILSKVKERIIRENKPNKL